MKSRTRFAPSPTGFLHVGAARTALFAWLVAKQDNDGTFILRLEDTDKKREVEGAAEHIAASLQALGLTYDEGPEVGGNYGPYRQSERLEIYRKWAEELIAKGRAYADPYTPEEIQSFREQAQAEKRPFLFRNHRPDSPPEWDGSTPLRFKSDPKPHQWQDEVMGSMQAGPEVVDDFIILKSDGYPTYNFAHIVDDHEMKITHVIRGQEFLASLPNYLNLYEALGLTPPTFASMPPIMGPDGKKKLSKRDNAKDVLEYIEQGFLPDALISFIATLGWNDGTTKEIFTREDLLASFSLSQVGKGGAIFDETRLRWTNGHFIRNMSQNELYEACRHYLPPRADNYDEQYNRSVISLAQERLKFFAELPELTLFFYEDLPVDESLISGHKKLKKYDRNRLIELLNLARGALDSADFTADNLTEILNKLLEETDEKPVVLFSLIRIATTQAPASPALADTLAVLGKTTVLERIDKQIEALED